MKINKKEFLYVLALESSLTFITYKFFDINLKKIGYLFALICIIHAFIQYIIILTKK